MAKDVILLGGLAARGATMLEILCGRCDRPGRLSVQRLLARHRPDAPVGHVMEAEIGACPKCNHAQIQSRCDPDNPTLGEMFGRARGLIRDPRSGCIAQY